MTLIPPFNSDYNVLRDISSVVPFRASCITPWCVFRGVCPKSTNQTICPKRRASSTARPPHRFEYNSHHQTVFKPQCGSNV